MNKPVRNFYEFGEFRLDPTERLLLHSGEPVHLQSRAFDTLLALVKNSGHLVHKQKLLETVWADSFVEENNLTQNISVLRKVLNGTGKSYIETVARHGYRFTAEVREVFEETEPEIQIENRSLLRIKLEEQIEESEDSSPSRFALSRKSLAAVLVVLFIAGSFFTWRIATGKNERKSIIIPTEVKTLAVIPFQIENPTNADEFLGQVIADDLSRQIKQSKSFKLRFMTPGSKVLENQTDTQTLAGLLKADAVLTGIVRRNGETFEIKTQLVKTGNGAILWTEKFENADGDIYKINDAIVQKFSVPLETKHRPADLETYKLYLKARALWNKRTGAELHQSIFLMEQAIARDPNFALAYAGLADGYAFDWSLYPKAIEMANKALEIDPGLGEAHATLGFVRLFWEWNVAESERHFKQAIALNPHYATAHQWYAALFAVTGRFIQPKTEIQTALDLEPASLPINADAGKIFYLAQEYEKALDHCQRAIALDPNFINTHGYLYKIYTMKGMYDEAIAAYFKREELTGVDAKIVRDRNAKLKQAYADGGIQGFWKEMLTPLLKTHGYDIRAEYHALLGNREEALRNLELSFENREFEFLFVLVNPIFSSYRDDPRFIRVTTPFNVIPYK